MINLKILLSVAIMTLTYMGHAEAAGSPQQKIGKNDLSDQENENAHKMMLFKHGMTQSMGDEQKVAIDDASKGVSSNLHALTGIKFTPPTPAEVMKQRIPTNIANPINKHGYNIEIKGIKYAAQLRLNPDFLKSAVIGLDVNNNVEKIEFRYGNEASHGGESSLRVNFKETGINPKTINFDKSNILKSENDGRLLYVNLNTEFTAPPNTYIGRKITAPTFAEVIEQMVPKNNKEHSFNIYDMEINGIKYEAYLARKPDQLQDVVVHLKNNIIMEIDFIYAFKDSPDTGRLSVDLKEMGINPKTISFDKSNIIKSEGNDMILSLNLKTEFTINPK